MPFEELKQRQSVMWGAGRRVSTWSPRQSAPPEGVGNPLDRGREEYVTSLLGDAFDLEFAEVNAVQTGESGEEVCALYRDHFGPTKTLYESLDENRRQELARTMVEFYEKDRVGDEIRHERLDLVFLGTRR
jgi:hypothetical protein